MAALAVRSEVRAPYETAPVPDAPPAMAEYRCRRCGRWLFSSDAAYGRLRVTCPGRGCRTAQVVFLGGRQAAP